MKQKVYYLKLTCNLRKRRFSRDTSKTFFNVKLKTLLALEL